MGFNTSTGLGGSFSLTPMPSPTVSDNNYLDLANTANQGWAQQYLPELYAEEVERRKSYNRRVFTNGRR